MRLAKACCSLAREQALGLARYRAGENGPVMHYFQPTLMHYLQPTVMHWPICEDMHL